MKIRSSHGIGPVYSVGFIACGQTHLISGSGMAAMMAREQSEGKEGRGKVVEGDEGREGRMDGFQEGKRNL